MIHPAFVTVVTGDTYSFFLRPHLDSVVTHHPHARVLVYHHDLSVHVLEGLRRQFPGIEFISQSVPGAEPKYKIIGGKLRFYCAGLALLPDGAETVLIDSDTLVTRSLDPAFARAFDLAFTWKRTSYPLNTGVVFVRNTAAARALLFEWNRRTQEILSSKPLELVARRKFGAADQMSLAELIADDPNRMPDKTSGEDSRAAAYDREHTRVVNGDTARMIGLPCEQYNEVNSRPLTEDTRVIHYKTGWHPILLHRKPYTANRPEHASREMHRYWDAATARSMRALADALVDSVPETAGHAVAAPGLPRIERGILNSELVLLYWFVTHFGVTRIIESGRWLGHSTLMMAKLFEATRVRIDSIDLFRSPAGDECERRLSACRNVTLYYGNAVRMVPELLARSEEPTVLLIDGPKGARAVDLVQSSFDRFPQIAAAFIHDAHLGSRARELIEATFPGSAFTDEPAYVEKFSFLDADVPVGEIHPDQFHGDPHRSRQGASYGPTLALILPHRPSRGSAGLSGLMQRASDKIRYGLGTAEARGREAYYKLRELGQSRVAGRD